MAVVCQTDFESARPGDYFPATFIQGTCDACGDEPVFVARVTKAEAESTSTQYSETEAIFGAEGATR